MLSKIPESSESPPQLEILMVDLETLVQVFAPPQNWNFSWWCVETTTLSLKDTTSLVSVSILVSQGMNTPQKVLECFV